MHDRLRVQAQHEDLSETNSARPRTNGTLYLGILLEMAPIHIIMQHRYTYG